MLSSLPTIAPPNWEQVFVVNPSVGEDTLQALLMQKDGKLSFMQPIYFANRIMTSTGKGYSNSEQMEFEYAIQIENSTRASFASLLNHQPFDPCGKG